MDNWLSMVSAPRDGSVIIVLYKDYSGVQAVRWGETSSVDIILEPKEQWFYADWSDAMGFDESFAGWIPCPQYPSNNSTTTPSNESTKP